MALLTIVLAILFWLSVFLIIYTYIGYPVLIAFIAKLIPFQGGASSVLDPSVTLLITAYNEEAVIEKKIENSLLLNYPPDRLQIIVAADGSSDRTVEIVGSFHDRGVKLNHTSLRDGKLAAINRAIVQAHGDIVVFSDANNIYDPDAIRKLITPFSDPSVGASTGAKLIIQDGGDLSGAEGIYWKYESWIKTNETILGTCTSSVGEILAIRRELYQPPPSHIINDDYYIVLDLIKRGFRVFYVADARSFEYISATVRDEMVRRTRMNTGKYQAMFMSSGLLPFNRPIVLWQIVSHKYFRALLPFGFIGALLANIFLVLLPGDTSTSLLRMSVSYAEIFLSIQLFFYLLAALGNLVKLPGLLGKMFYLPTYLVNSNIAILRGFYGFISGKQTNIWERVRRGNV
ncbi:MAG TPA: glycosyltransferase family 2 protein [Anaerolineales bacterium]|nr:glycosyltransferase family 2 protein [Anaerolineales bacterium]